MDSYRMLLPDNASLYFETHGKGSPILLIAGLASDSQSWGGVVQDLARDFLVITPDNRGVGRSTQNGVDISISGMGDDCIALLDYLGIASAEILGHSMGGFVALDCALRYPDRLSGLLIAGSAPRNSPENNQLVRAWASDLTAGADRGDWFRGLFPWIFTPSFLPDAEALDAAVSYSVDYPYPQSAEAFRKQVEAIAGFDCTGEIATIKLPTLIIHGREDRLFPSEESVRRLKSINGARSIVFERAAHSIHLEQPEAFSRAIREFIKR